MTATKFTTAFCKKSNRIGQALAYALLEWILIALLLANGVFSYLISKFAAFFGLAPPCVLCSRLGVDSVFEPCEGNGSGGVKSLLRVLCDAHGAEVSRLGYCGAHRRLAEAGDMCEDCAASAPFKAPVALSWMRRSELGEKDLACACCGIALESGFYSPSFLLPRPSLSVLDCGYKRGDTGSTNKDAVSMAKEVDKADPEREERKEGNEFFNKKPLVEDDSISVMARCAENVSGDERLVPLESIESMAVTMVAISSKIHGEGKHDVDHEPVERDAGSLDIAVDAKEEEELVLASDDGKVDAVLNQMIDDEIAAFVISPASLEERFDGEMRAMEIEEGFTDQQKDNKMKDMDAYHEISIGSAISEEEQVELSELKQEPISVSMDSGENITVTLNGNADKDKEDIELDAIEATFPNLLQFSPELAETNLPSLAREHNEVEEGRAPDTPTHIEGICDLPKLFDFKRKGSGAESLDGSVANMSTETEGSETVTADQLKSALIAARKSLNALYAELDNERNAAAIAADETMAMINRLQEQKAAMQMEAVQYQRLMEEQSEYDQEALQRLNELVVKREKEKQDLERELELYRHKVRLYEAKERRNMSRHKADDQNGSSSASSSAEDSDDLSPSFYEGDESAHGLNGSNSSIPTDAVLQETARHLVTLDDSLADFEEERLSIMEQLKVLEERLFDLEDEESDDHISEENHLNNAANGFSDEKDDSFKHCNERKYASYRGKRLLPLFDEVSLENGNGLLKKLGATEDSSPKVVLELAKEQEKLLIADEVDHVYERLQALEADREFLKHCIRSLNKGGKGLDLLQEILQHLRELRRIEQRARNSGELSPHYLHPYTD